MNLYPWLKLAHLFFIISWFAGLFYLPRIYVNLAQTDPETEPAAYHRLLGMAERLYKFMSPWGWGAVVCGAAIPFVTGWWGNGWVHVKLTIGLALLGYQFYCGRLLQAFIRQRNTRSHKWYRVFNEIPVLLMMAALYLVMFKPF
ncbi:CopD family protein [Neisseria sp. ZJ106]|uniref:Protoporphyrinogen IX oxidase n=1 Tax=Neisseria lisongii TaxID=2912188 RepID=A0AAW5AMU9_9NEIS|nr:CopD family protein [Neisseria lisongii]MCF7522187.1 CopD family protein [Neisseria lisongii]MCF7530569.1 CopD family protein [Neisseria lisongii]WCL71327.1 CopD family protein [Neisseria lisongii]